MKNNSQSRFNISSHNGCPGVKAERMSTLDGVAPVPMRRNRIVTGRSVTMNADSRLSRSNNNETNRMLLPNTS